MKIWYGTIAVTIVILTGYLVFVLDLQFSRMNASAEAAQSDNKLLQQKLDKQMELLAKVQAEIDKIGKDKAAPPKPPQEDKGKIAVDSLRASLTTLTEADAKKQEGDINAAVDLLKSVKKTLWQTGDTLPAHQAALRALMGPLDVVIGKWKQGDKIVDTSKIALAVRAVLQKIDSKFDT